MENPESVEILGKEFILWVLINQIGHIIYKARDKELGQNDVTIRQSSILLIVNAIKEAGGVATPNEISKWSLREPNTVSALISRMERDGLITKSRGSGKWNNHIIVELTEKGEQAYRLSLNKGIIQEILSCFSEEEYEIIFSLLKRLRDNALEKTTIAREVPFPQ